VRGQRLLDRPVPPHPNPLPIWGEGARVSPWLLLRSQCSVLSTRMLVSKNAFTARWPRRDRSDSLREASSCVSPCWRAHAGDAAQSVGEDVGADPLAGAASRSTRSTGRPRSFSSASLKSRQAARSFPTAGVNVIRTSISLVAGSNPAPRAAEPNTSRRAPPRWRHSAVRSERLSAMIACIALGRMPLRRQDIADKPRSNPGRSIPLFIPELLG
jgi:hypothetical protein